jgi:hypothetical protein
MACRQAHHSPAGRHTTHLQVGVPACKPNYAVLNAPSYVKFESGATRDSRQWKRKRQEMQAANVEFSNELHIALHVSQKKKNESIHYFKDSFVCYANQGWRGGQVSPF